MMLRGKMRGYVRRGGGVAERKSVTEDQSHTLFALTAGRTVAAVDVWPGSFLMAAGGLVDRQCRRCAKHSRGCLKTCQSANLRHIRPPRFQT